MPLDRLGTPVFIGETKDFQRGPDGALTDFGRAQAAAWSDMISRIKDRAIASVEAEGRAQQPGYRSRFFNRLRFDPVGGDDPIPVLWDGFPKRIGDFFDCDEKWARAAEFEVATAGNPASRLFEVDSDGRLVRRMEGSQPAEDVGRRDGGEDRHHHRGRVRGSSGHAGGLSLGSA